jgi:hypothetical protein
MTENDKKMNVNEIDNTEAKGKSLTNLLILYAVFAVLMFVLAGINKHWALLSETVSNALVALGISIVLFGLLDSAAQVKTKNKTNPNIVKSVSLGGAMAGFFVVFMLLEPAKIEPTTDLETKLFDVSFSAPLSGAEQKELFKEAELRFTQYEPQSTYSDYPLLPTKKIGEHWGQYEVKERDLKEIGSTFRGTIKRAVTSSYSGSPNAVPNYKLCFERKEVGNIIAKFHCEASECKIDDQAQRINACQLSSALSFDNLGLFSKAYAQSIESGWITPSLDTLQKTYKASNETYVEFAVSSNNLRLTEAVVKFKYQIRVNGTPVFINGWTEEETIQYIDVSKPFSLKFGLQNLDFSGAEYGQEHIELTLTFYTNKGEYRQDVLNRAYVALRSVKKTNLQVNDVNYKWSGQQYFGTNDGFEVFFWSSKNSDELVNRRKKFFDEEKLKLNDYELVAVVRPPLGENKSFGLVLGLKETNGRVDFTFSETRAQEIEQWINQNLRGKRTRKRPETGFDHPLIKSVNVFELDGQH